MAEKTKEIELVARYPDDEDVKALVDRLGRAEKLLDKALYEFGGDLRGEIESFLGVEPLLPR